MNWLSRGLIHASYYPTLGFNYLMIGLGIWRRWSWIDPNVLLGAAPSRHGLRKLRELGITRVVNLCEEFAGDAEGLAANGIEQLHLPSVDYRCPPVETLLRGVEYIQNAVAEGRKVYLHCKAGRLRSPCLAVCYLMAARHVTARAAYDMVRAVRWHINRRIYDYGNIRAIETRLGIQPPATS